MSPKSRLTIAAFALGAALSAGPNAGLSVELASLSVPASYAPPRSGPALPDSVPPGARLDDFGAFGSTTVPVGRIAALAQWSAAARLDRQSDCGGRDCASPTGQKFVSAVVAARLLPPLQAIKTINRAVNHAVIYRAEARDRWASAAETVAAGQGDCEDFAIAKRALLIEAGFAPETLQFVVLEDLRRHVQHAVLVVHQNGARLVLDNMSDTVGRDTLYPNYHPIASIVGEREYLHGFVRSPDIRVAEGPSPTETLRPGFYLEANWLDL